MDINYPKTTTGWSDAGADKAAGLYVETYHTLCPHAPPGNPPPSVIEELKDALRPSLKSKLDARWPSQSLGAVTVIGENIQAAATLDYVTTTVTVNLSMKRGIEEEGGQETITNFDRVIASATGTFDARTQGWTVV